MVDKDDKERDESVEDGAQLSDDGGYARLGVLE